MIALSRRLISAELHTHTDLLDTHEYVLEADADVLDTRGAVLKTPFTVLHTSPAVLYTPVAVVDTRGSVSETALVEQLEDAAVARHHFRVA